MTRPELRAAMRRQALDTAAKLLELAFGEYGEGDSPTADEADLLTRVWAAYEAARRAACPTE